MSSGNYRQQWRELAIEKKLSIVVVPVLIAAISVGIPLLAQGGGSDPPAPSPTAATAALQVVDLAVTGGDVSKPGGYDNTQAIDLTVRNTGDVVSVVTRARLVVRDTGMLTICQAGGGLGPSETYDVQLPADAAKGETVDAKVSQQIQPGAADRFDIRLDVPEPERQTGFWLYQLDVLLSHDGAPKPLQAGTVLVSAPYLPAPGVFWSGTENKESYEGAGSAEVKRCLQDNEATLERMLAVDGERSPQMGPGLLEPPAGL
jgi:hypothetical protein